MPLLSYRPNSMAHVILQIWSFTISYSLYHIGDENLSVYFKAYQSQNPPCSCEKKLFKKGDILNNNKTDLCDENQFIPIGKID